MAKITNLGDFKEQYKPADVGKTFWFGPRATDVSGLIELLNLSGIIACYGGSELNDKLPVLSGDLSGVREKSSGDDLARALLTNHKYTNFIKKNNFSAVLPYDAPIELEQFCEGNNIKCFSSSSLLKDRLRDKTKVEDIGRSIGLPVIPGISGLMEDFDYKDSVNKFGLPLFLQFEGSAGSGNYIVKTAKKFNKLKRLKQGGKLNIKKYFVGRSCSIDICVTPKSILCGTLEEMLIGAEPLNTNPTEYVGGSWFESDFPLELRKKVLDIGTKLGKYMKNKGFIGYFHPDFLIAGDDVYLTEINMRFGGSCGIYAKSEIAEKRVPLMGVHLLSFVNPNQKYDAQKINNLNLQPMNYAFMVIKNTNQNSVIVAKTKKSGVYRLTESNIEFVSSNGNFSNLKGDLIEIIGLPDSGKDTIVEYGAFICQVVTRFPIIDKQNKLNKIGNEVVQKMNRFLLG